MIRKGEEYTCDRCGKTMFVENGDPKRAQWHEISIEINGSIVRKRIWPTKTLCYRCAEELETLLDVFFDLDNIAR